MRAFAIGVLATACGGSLPDAPQNAERQEQEAPKPAPDNRVIPVWRWQGVAHLRLRRARAAAAARGMEAWRPVRSNDCSTEPGE